MRTISQVQKYKTVVEHYIKIISIQSTIYDSIHCTNAINSHNYRRVGVPPTVTTKGGQLGYHELAHLPTLDMNMTMLLSGDIRLHFY